MIVNSTAILGRANAGKPIGYKVLTIKREPFAEFTRENVLETSPGRFAPVGGVNVPNEGAFVAWGLPGGPFWEDAIQPAPAEVVNAVTRRMSDLLGSFYERFVRAIPAPLAPIVQMETATFEQHVAELRAELTELARQMLTGDSARTQSVAELQAQVETAVEHITSLRSLNNTARTMGQLGILRDKLNDLFGAQSPVVQMFQTGGDEHVAEMLETQMQRIDALTRSIQAERPKQQMLRESLQAMDQFIEQYGGNSDE